MDYTNIMKDKTGYLTPVEINKMLNYAYNRIEDGFIGSLWMRNYLLLLTLQRTGRRVSEVVGVPPFQKVKGLRPMDLHDDYLIEFSILKKNPIREKTNKGKVRKKEVLDKLRFNKEPKKRLLPVDKWLYDMLNKYIEINGINPYQRIFPITRQRVDAIIKFIAKQTGVARENCKIHAHHFRHSFAINFLKKNPNNPMALIQLKNYMQHSSTQITEHYTQFTPDDLRPSLEKAYQEEEKDDESEGENRNER